MPIIKSAKKQLKQNIKARKKNTAQKDDMKKVLKAIEKLLKDEKIEEALKKVSEAYSKIDRLQKNNLMHQNKAARKKSQLKRKVDQISANSK